MNRVCSIFSQLLQLFSRAEFERAVKDHKAERHAPRLCELVPVVAMLFCQLGRAHSCARSAAAWPSAKAS